MVSGAMAPGAVRSWIQSLVSQNCWSTFRANSWPLKDLSGPVTSDQLPPPALDKLRPQDLCNHLIRIKSNWSHQLLKLFGQLLHNLNWLRPGLGG
jgi:hypothetical protein